MKKHNFISVGSFSFLIGAFCFSMSLYGQKAEKARRKSNAQAAVTSRSQELYTSSLPQTGETIWMREIYRQLDLINQKENRPLYYPAEPQQGKSNFFTTIFRLIYTNKISAYEYRDGEEVFDDLSKIKILDFFEKFHIIYSKKSKGRIKEYVVEDSDIPSAEVKTIYIKEQYVFDQRSSQYISEVVAVCPVLHREDEFGGAELKYPLFWVKMNDLRPYLSEATLMVSDLNNASNSTFNDFFALRLYKGDIYKSANLLNRTLMQYCPNEDSLLHEQKRIEGELSAFENNLWACDTLQLSPSSKKDKKTSKCSTPTSSKKFSSSNTVKSKGENSDYSNGAVHSVRRDR